MEFQQAADHVNWSPAKKLAVRETAARLGQLEKFVIESRLWPWLVLAGFAGVCWLAGWGSEALAAMLPRP